MRKWIIYILIFAVSLMMIISTVLLISIYKNTANIQINKNDELAKTDNNTIVDNNEIVTTSYSNIKISPNASIVFKTLYKECNHIIEEERKADSNTINKNELDFKELYNVWELKKFTQDEVVLYREINGLCNEHYIIKDDSGYVKIFTINQNGEEELVESTLIAVQYLPEADVSELKQGIKVYGMEEVNKIIEDFE